LSQQEKKQGWLGNIAHKVFGNKERTETATEFERLGVKWTLDWHLATRIDTLQKVMAAVELESDLDKKLRYYDGIVTQVALPYGEARDDPDFFQRFIAWEQLYGFYKIGRDSAGLTQEELIARYVKLEVGAKAVVAAAMRAKHVTPNTPIVLFVPNSENRFTGFGGDNPAASDRY